MTRKIVPLSLVRSGGSRKMGGHGRASGQISPR